MILIIRLISIVYNKIAEDVYRVMYYVHIFDVSSQDSEAVTAILSDVLQRVKREMPSVTTAYIRSDNVGCYHSAQTIASINDISTKTNVHILR